MDQVSGYIERITFQSEESGFTVAQLKEKGKRELTCLVGTMPTLMPGETVRCFGNWKIHLVHGQQFEVISLKSEAPADVVGIKKYLGSGLIKGIGPKYAEMIVQTFGIDTLEIIDKEPDRLGEIKGFGPKRVGTIKTCWQAQRVIRDVMIFLQAHGVSPTYAQKIFKVYEQKSIQVVRETPFQLAKDIPGIGFRTADQIGQKVGVEHDAPQRLEAGLEYLLSELSNEGHVCYPERLLLEEGEKMLEVEKDLLTAAIDVLLQEGRIYRQTLMQQGNEVSFLWIISLYRAERGIAKEISRLVGSLSSLRAVDTQKAVAWAEQEMKIELAVNQKKAVATALSEKVLVITGGPGTGKSTITNCILRITAKLSSRILLAAPTGRAAKRMSEITKKPASTIHTLLGVDFKAGGFKHNRKNPLICDLIIIDEASMIDTLLMNQLLKAIPDHARVIFVGDIFQLPSVGPGNVLQDLIASNTIAVNTLTEIFRQAAGSAIITNAHKINHGQFPDISNRSSSDFFFVDEEDPEKVLSTILAIVAERLPRKYGYSPFDDIQVLAPMKRGVIGTENLNSALQEQLNPKSGGVLRYGRELKVDDKVMQIRNNYQKEVFNGDIGRVTKVDTVEQQLIVTFDSRPVTYDFADLDELVLAYAVSIHKYQGSECPCIVMPIHTTHFKLLHRNLLYTGVTRGKKLVILVGTKKALWIAVKNNDVLKRYTALKPFLQEQLTHAPI